ncbi:MAG: RsiV family protein [Paludibacter sp.]|jgi:hypothetical protein|nr:RsiV family protein [Paludibacter sp.]
MKKIAIIILLSSILLFSCKQTTVKNIEKSISTTEYLSADTSKGALYINIDVEIPICFHDKDVLTKIQTNVFAALFGDAYKMLSPDSVLYIYTDELIAEYHENNDDFLAEADSLLTDNAENLFLNNSFNLEGFSLLSYVNKHIYTYGIHTEAYTGGAHGNYSTIYLNYNLTNGQRITENDLFVENYGDSISEILKQCLVEKSLTDPEMTDIENWEESDYWENEIKPNGNFYFNEDGINYYFNPYEIAPFSMGETEILVPYSKIITFLKSDYLFLLSK